MIKNNFHLVKVSNRNLAKLKSLGYSAKSGEYVQVKTEHAPGKLKIACVCDKCGIEYSVTNEKLNDIASSYCKIHRWEKYGEIRKDFYSTPQGKAVAKNRGDAISKNRVGKGLKPESHWIDKKKYHQYCMSVKRHQYKFNKLIQELPGFSSIGLNGIEGATQIDHIVSKRFGYDNSVPPEIIGHICNLQIIPWKKNLEKSDTNGMTLENLLTLIDKYEGKSHGVNRSHESIRIR